MSDAQPITGLCPGDLAPHAFVCGDPARVERITAGWDEQRVVAQVREYTVVTGSKDGVPRGAPTLVRTPTSGMRAQPVRVREASRSFRSSALIFSGRFRGRPRKGDDSHTTRRALAYRRRRQLPIVLLPLARTDLSRLHDGHQHDLERPLWGLPTDADQSEQSEKVRQMQQRLVLLEGVSDLGLEASEQTGTQTPVRGFSRGG